MVLCLSTLGALLSVLTLPGLACYGGAAMGIGGAFTSLADGVLAIYWNQAGLAFTPGRGEVSKTVTTPQDNTNYNSFVGVAVKVTDRLGLGFGETKTAPWANDEQWDTLAVGYRLTDRLAVGGALRKVHGVDFYSRLPYDETAFDLSAQYRAGLLNFGLLVQDAGGPNATNSYMQNIRPAVSFQTDKLTLAFDVYDAESLTTVARNEYSPYLDHQVGLEYRPWGKEGPLALRGGFYQSYLMYGVGLKAKNAFLDVTWMPDPLYPAVQLTGGFRF